nr:hypothetical protein [Lachnospiraceae bacterium]
MFEDKITYLVGEELPVREPVIPYDDHVCEFLNVFSLHLMRDTKAKKYSDIMSLAFWCRRASIEKKKSIFQESNKNMACIGRGIVFHIAPSNVPVNFAFSYFFGLLSGNANIVRVPSKEFPQTEIICDILKQVFDSGSFEDIRKKTLLVSYERNKDINDYFSGLCDARVIWGGDSSISAIRESELKPRAVEIVFADRYSMAVFNAEAMNMADENELTQLAEAFYNDTYLMDQNACSSPHFIYWISPWDEKKTAQVKEKFWESVYQASKKYDLEPIKAVDKYTDFCHLAMEREDIQSVCRYGNRVYVIALDQLPGDISSLRGKFGLFFELTGVNFEEICPVVDEKFQTLLYFGIERQELVEMIVNNHLTGIDRIVPVGNSLDIDVFWDGYDIIGTLSRK